MDLTGTIGAGGQWRISKVLEDVKTMTTRFTKILVSGHISAHSLDSIRLGKTRPDTRQEGA
jgi:hypothetical protein